MRTIRAKTTCPACGFVNTAQTNYTDDSPGDGDYAICLQCSFVAIYAVSGEQISVRRPTADEEREIGENPEVQRMLRAIDRLDIPGRSLNALRNAGKRN